MGRDGKGRVRETLFIFLGGLAGKKWTGLDWT